MSYRTMLKAICDNDLLYEAVLKLNFEALERQRMKHKESGVRCTETTVIKLAQAEMCREIIQEMK